jgi:hypothetical protein
MHGFVAVGAVFPPHLSQYLTQQERLDETELELENMGE